MDSQPLDIAPLFRAVALALSERRVELNRMDSYNGNHGDHMVEIFEIATRAAGRIRPENLAAAMANAAQQLREQTHNGSAQIYASGLEQFSQQLQKYQIGLDDLVFYVRSILAEKKDNPGTPGKEISSGGKAGVILKVLVSGLSGWQQAESGDSTGSQTGLDMGYLFELGMVYMQAKRRSDRKIDVLADAAVSASPLSQVPYRSDSGRLAMRALLQALAAWQDPLMHQE